MIGIVKDGLAIREAGVGFVVVLLYFVRESGRIRFIDARAGGDVSLAEAIRQNK